MTKQTTIDKSGPQQPAAAEPGETDDGDKTVEQKETRELTEDDESSGENTDADAQTVKAGTDTETGKANTDAKTVADTNGKTVHIETDTETVEAGTGEAGTARRRWWPSKRLLWTIGGFAAVVVLLVCGVLTWQALNQDNKTLTQVAGTQIGRDPRNPALATYDDSETRFRLSFPVSWATQRVGGADVRLVAGPGGGDLMSIRVVSLDTGSAAPPTPDSLKPYLDTIVNEPGVTMLQQNQISMGALTGWYYVYTFQDSATKAQGIHNQYFMIRGNQLYSIVFQALPQSDFSPLAPVYQQVVNSIQFY